MIRLDRRIIIGVDTHKDFCRVAVVAWLGESSGDHRLWCVPDRLQGPHRRGRDPGTVLRARARARARAEAEGTGSYGAGPHGSLPRAALGRDPCDRPRQAGASAPWQD